MILLLGYRTHNISQGGLSLIVNNSERGNLRWPVGQPASLNMAKFGQVHSSSVKKTRFKTKSVPTDTYPPSKKPEDVFYKCIGPDTLIYRTIYLIHEKMYASEIYLVTPYISNVSGCLVRICITRMCLYIMYLT
jgi:hypothetical protein